ncbi:MAG: S8 family serine peptidase [Pyrinomonadaceae bacterium]
MTRTRIRLFGALAVLAIFTVVCWQLLPESSAQRKDRTLKGDSDESVTSASQIESPDMIMLSARRIDVKSSDVQAERQNIGGFSGKRLHLVRFNGPIRSKWVDMLTDSGVEVVNYIPHYTYLVYGDAAALSRIQSESRNALSPIEWEGPYRDEYKVMPTVYRDPKGEKMAQSGLKTDQFSVQLYRDKFVNDQTLSLVDKMKTAPIKGGQEILHYYNFVVGLDKDGLATLASQPDVISIHPYVEPQKYDERQNLILRGNLTGVNPTAGNYLDYLLGQGFTQAQFDTSAFAVDVTDSGVDTATPANPNMFLLRTAGDPAGTSRYIYSRLEGTPNAGSTLQGCDGHGNLNATVVGGYVPSGGIFAAAPHADALGYRYGLGVAPFVRIGSSVIFDPDNFTSPNYANLQSRAYQDGARISTNSWGANVGGAYTADAQAYDALVRDAQPATSVNPTAGNQEMVILFSAGNAGSGANTIGAPGTGKNVLTVGASENVHPFGGADGCGLTDTGADSAMDVIGFSSRGPNDDGRFKPEIMLPGTHITGGVAQNVNSSPVAGNGEALPCFLATGVCGGPGPNFDFFPLGGQEWYTASSGTSHSTPAVAGMAALIRQHFINQALPPASPAMTKAIIVNSAEYMTGAGANDNLPSNNQGMGLADLDRYFDIFAQSSILEDQDNSNTFSDTGQQRIYTGTVAVTDKPFRVTLAWTDAPGPTSGNAYVNNLDLEVTVGGNTYKGNVFTGGSSTTGGVADVRNNVESVFVPAGVSGSFIIKVKGTNIAGDGIPNNADTTDQDYALVVSNADESPQPVVESGSTAITAESCAINNAIDPLETVTIDFAFANVGTANTTDLVATLLATGGVSAPSAPQNLGIVIANGPTVVRPFTFTADSDCGERLTATFQLQDGMTNLGTVTYVFNTGALAAPTTVTYSTGNISTPIPDQGSVDIPINATNLGVVADVNVGVRLNHTFDGDVTMALISPEGVTVPLVNNRGGSGDNFGTGANDCSGTRTILDDAAGTAISAGTAPFAGSFRPESPLSAFNGQLMSGTWILRVADTAAQDVGTVGCVQLEISRQGFSCCGVTLPPNVVAGGAAALISESFTPPNSAPDPGETVTVNLPLLNNGDGPTSSLVATLQNSGGVTPITNSQNYGAMSPGDPAVSRAFTFVANGVCGDNITITLQLQDGALNLGTVSYNMRLGTISSSELSFSNNTSITIPGSGAASLYPSTINVTGAPTSISGAKVTITGFDHTFPADVDFLLVNPAGRKFILESDGGGLNPVTARNYTFADDAAGLFPQATAASGTYRPANYGTGDAFPAPAPVSPYLSPATAGTETLASAFSGVTGGDPNGTWSLYIVDDAAGDSGTLTGGWSLTLISSSNVCSNTPGNTRRIRADFDGDKKTDLSVYRPSEGNWYVYGSQLGFLAANWGIPGDQPLAGDFSGDGETDLVVRRHVGDTVTPDIHVLKTDTFTYEGISWGTATDIILVGDYDGDNKDEVAAFRPADQAFYIRDDLLQYRVVLFGASTDIPMAIDIDGDRRTDLGVFRPSNGTFYVATQSGNSFANFQSIPWGVSTDIPVPADYDGDEKDDIAVYRPSDGTWYIRLTATGNVRYEPWGVSTDIPVPGDYDGDGEYDVAVYRDGTWYIKGSQAGFQVGFWGVSTDVPIPRKYLP